MRAPWGVEIVEVEVNTSTSVATGAVFGSWMLAGDNGGVNLGVVREDTTTT